MKKISFNIPSGQLLSILKGDATRFVDYSPKTRPNYHIGEQLQISPEQVSLIISTPAIRNSVPFKTCFLNTYNDIFSFPTDTFFMIQITNVRQLQATEFTLIDTLRLGIKSCKINGVSGYMIPNFSNYTCQIYSSQICTLNAFLHQTCTLPDEIVASNPTYNLYEFTTIINPKLEEEDYE